MNTDYGCFYLEGLIGNLKKEAGIGAGTLYYSSATHY